MYTQKSYFAAVKAEEESKVKVTTAIADPTFEERIANLSKWTAGDVDRASNRQTAIFWGYSIFKSSLLGGIYVTTREGLEYVVCEHEKFEDARDSLIDRLIDMKNDGLIE